MSFDERLVTRLLSIDGSADAISALSNYIQLLDDAPGSVASWWEALQRALAGPDSGGNLAVALPLLHLCHELLVRGARARSQVYAAAFAAQLERAMAAAARALPAAQLQSLQRLPGLWRERAIFSPRFAGVLAAAVTLFSPPTFLTPTSSASSVPAPPPFLFQDRKRLLKVDKGALQ